MIKKELRSRYRAVRDNVYDRELKSDIITSAVIENEFFVNSKEVFLYSPSGSEVFTNKISDAAHRLGKRIAYPRCIDRDGEMEFYFVDSHLSLCEGMYGIYEPCSNESKIAVPSSESLIIVPALTYDLYGYRLGYGKGYYDRYLSRYPCKTVGIAFDECVCKELPHGIYDCKINCLITDKSIYYFD